MSAATATIGRLIPPIPRKAWAVLVALLVAVIYVALRGQFTIPHDNDAPTFHAINDIREWIDIFTELGLPIISVDGGLGLGHTHT